MFDLLSDVLEMARFHSFVFGKSELSAPWGVRFPAGPEEVPDHVGPPKDEIPEPLRGRKPPHPSGCFYAIMRGNCLLEIDGRGEALTLAGGDLIVLMRAPGHVLRDGPTSAVRPLWKVHPFERVRRHQGLLVGGGGPVTTLMGGAFFFQNHQDSRFVSSLPPILHIRAEDGRIAPWLEDTVRFMAYEMEEYGPGSRIVINHLSQILFIQAVRAYVRTIPAGDGNWLQAILDPEIGPALGSIHHHPEVNWTVASLAETVAMSRSAFAARFMQLVGEPPLQYLTRRRMDRAMEMLRETRQAIKEIAQQVGYESEAAFSKAFRRMHGLAPGAYRKSGIIPGPPPSGRPEAG